MSKAPLIVIGAGAGGIIAAGRAAELGAKVVLLEKMEQPGKKLLISGQTRCNLTNTAPLEEFIGAYGSNGRFLYHAFGRFFRDELLAFLGQYGLATKVERGGRIFPSSDKATDVVATFRRYLADNRVDLHTGIRVTGIEVNGGRVVGVCTPQRTIPTSTVVLATGGASYPTTGSAGDGYRLAASLGHTIVKLRPALVPLVVDKVELAASMQGVGLKNVRLTAFERPAEQIEPAFTLKYNVGRGTGREKAHSPLIESRLGEMLFTHFGIGGPVTLQMSLAIVDALSEGPVSVSIDLKPGLSVEQLRRRLQRDFDTYGKRNYENLLHGLLPPKMIAPFVSLTGVPADKPGHQITSEERERLLHTLKSLRFNIKQPLPLSSAMVTAGGVSLKEIDPYTMASRLVQGLYFCGEVMDIDADTGGYNLQAAFSTGWVAGEAAAERSKR